MEQQQPVASDGSNTSRFDGGTDSRTVFDLFNSFSTPLVDRASCIDFCMGMMTIPDAIAFPTVANRLIGSSIVENVKEGLQSLATLRSWNALEILALISGSESRLVIRPIDGGHITGVHFQETSLFEAVTRELGPLNASLLSWLSMQLRWVVWTLASYERRAPYLYFGKLLLLDKLQLCMLHRLNVYSGSRGLSTSNCLVGSCSEQRQHVNPYVTPGTKAPRVTGHVSAEKHFSTKGSMSPLQRCSDIACLVWPVVLCFATDASVVSGGSATHWVSDGWWWTRASLDVGLTQLLNNVS
jgi:hypothetical protein